MNREQYLTDGINHLSGLFLNIGYELPPVKVTCSWPGGGSAQSRIGECWPRQASPAGYNEIFISPLIDNPVRALDVLTHELIHAIDDCQHGHRKEFSQIAKAIGLEGKPTSTYAGEGLKSQLEDIVSKLGEYPHSGMIIPERKKQTTRMQKIECGDCGAVWRMASKWAEQALVCPCCASGNLIK